MESSWEKPCGLPAAAIAPYLVLTLQGAGSLHNSSSLHKPVTGTKFLLPLTQGDILVICVTLTEQLCFPVSCLFDCFLVYLVYFFQFILVCFFHPFVFSHFGFFCCSVIHILLDIQLDSTVRCVHIGLVYSAFLCSHTFLFLVST